MGTGVALWLEADVVVDVANLSHWIGDAVGASGPRRVDPSLVLLSHALGAYGVRTRSFVAAVPARPFVGVGRTVDALRPTRRTVGVTKNRERATSSITGASLWATNQRRDLKRAHLPSVRTVDGGTTGTTERGVDEMAALAALDLLWDLEQSSTEDGLLSGVILVSQDRDVEVCHLVASRRQLYGVGSDDGRTRNRAKFRDRRHGYRHLLLPDDLVRHLGVPEIDCLKEPGAYAAALDESRARIDGIVAGLALDVTGSSGAEQRHLTLPGPGGKRRRVSSDLSATDPSDRPGDGRSWEARRTRAVRGKRTIYIADPCGLQRTGARSLGVAGRPGPDTLPRLVVDHLGFPEPAVGMATVSDASDDDLQSLEHWIDGSAGEIRHEAQRYADGVRATDAVYDEIAGDFESDGDVVERATLDLHGRTSDGRAARLDDLRLQEKEVTVLLAADVLWALTRTGTAVVLLSDRVELQHVLENLPSIAATPERRTLLREAIESRLTRVGLHADPFVAEGFVAPPSEDGATPAAERRPGLPHEVALDGALAADLLGLRGRAYGPALEAAIHHHLQHDDDLWQVVGVDPWDHSLRVANLGGDGHDPDDGEAGRLLEAQIDHGMLVSQDVYEQLEAGVEGSELDLSIQIDPTRPCGISRLGIGADPADPSRLLTAVVVEAADGGVLLDTDGDLSTTDDRVVMRTGHGYTMYRRAMVVLVLRTPTGDRLMRVVGPDPTAGSGEGDPYDGLPVVGEITGARAARVPAEDPTAPELQLRAVPFARSIESEPRARLLVVPTSESDGYAISTALPHLQVGTRAT